MGIDSMDSPQRKREAVLKHMKKGHSIVCDVVERMNYNE